MQNTFHIEGDDFMILVNEITTELRDNLFDCAAPGQDATEAVDFAISHHDLTAENPRAYLGPVGAWDDEEIEAMTHDEAVQKCVWMLACNLREDCRNNESAGDVPMGSLSTY